MAESELHKRLKDAAEHWLRDNGCAIVVQEPTIIGWGNLPCRPDVYGVITDCRGHGLNFGETVEIECEPDLRGIADEFSKRHRREPSRSVGNIKFLLYPNTIEPDLETLRIPRYFGRMVYDGQNVSVVSPPGSVLVSREYERALFASMIYNLQRETGKQAAEARSSAGARLTPKQIQFLKDFIEDGGEAPLRVCAAAMSLDTKKLRKCALSGIPGITYDRDMKSLDLETAEART